MAAGKKKDADAQATAGPELAPSSEGAAPAADGKQLIGPIGPGETASGIATGDGSGQLLPDAVVDADGIARSEIDSGGEDPLAIRMRENNERIARAEAHFQACDLCTSEKPCLEGWLLAGYPEDGYEARFGQPPVRVEAPKLQGAPKGKVPPAHKRYRVKSPVLAHDVHAEGTPVRHFLAGEIGDFKDGHGLDHCLEELKAK